MPRFRTRPTVIEAYQVSERMVIPPTETFCQNILIVYPGDYLCTDDKGFKFPCRPEIFAKTYEPVAD